MFDQDRAEVVNYDDFKKRARALTSSNGLKNAKVELS